MSTLIHGMSEEEYVSTLTGSILEDLKSRNALYREKAANELGSVVQGAVRELSAETFTRFLSVLSPKLFELLMNSGETSSQLGAISAIHALIDVNSEDDDTKIIRFANYLRNFLGRSPAAASEVVEGAAKALGHLARAGGTLSADFVEFEVKRSLEWLQQVEKQQMAGGALTERRFAACLILKELSENTPTLFYVNVSHFFEYIWVAVRDSNVSVRIAATRAIAACLILIRQRKTRHRVQWYCKIYEQVQKGLGKRSEAVAIHGSLLVIGELLCHTGDFMVPRFKEVVETVLSYKDRKEKLVRRRVMLLLPQLASFYPDAFVRGYLDASLSHLMKAVKSNQARDRGTVYIALGELAIAVKEYMVPSLKTIVELVQEGMVVPKRNKPFCVEALVCVSHFAKAVGDELIPYMETLVNQMMLGGLNPTLIEALSEIVKHVPSYLIPIQERLIHELALILSGKSFLQPGVESLYYASAARHGGLKMGRVSSSFQYIPYTAASRFSLFSANMRGFSNLSPNIEEHASGSASTSLVTSTSHSSFVGRENIELIVLSLATLGSFNFSGISLLPFVQDCVLQYLEHEEVAVRIQAAKTCSKLLLPIEIRKEDNEDTSFILLATSPTSACAFDEYEEQKRPLLEGQQQLLNQSLRCRGPTANLICSVLHCMLTAAVADPDASVRLSVIQSLDSRFDPYLSLHEHLRLLFVALNDENSLIREATILLIGRLSLRNPAYVMPSLRKTLIQLLTDLRYNSGSRLQEASIKLLGQLIKASNNLIKPYLSPILAVLLPKLRDNNVAAGIVSEVLVTVGELALVAGSEMISYESELLPLIIETLQDHSSVVKREVALKTLGQLIGSTGSVVAPYLIFPHLLEITLGLLHHGATSPWRLRREGLKALGILGALDPYRHKICQMRLMVSLSRHPREIGINGDSPSAGSPENRKDEASLNAGNHRNLEEVMMSEDGMDHRLALFLATDGTTKGMKPGVFAFGNVPPPSDIMMNKMLPSTRSAGQNGLSDSHSQQAFDELYSKEHQVRHQQLTPSSDEYYPTVAITALMRILRDSSLNVHHHGVIQAVMFIFKSLGLKCVPFLTQILPPFLHVMRHCEDGLRESLFQQLANLITIVKQHLRRFLKSIFSLIKDYWEANLEQILSLINSISLAIQDEINDHMHELVPLLLEALQPEKTNTTVPSASVASLTSSSGSLAFTNERRLIKVMNTLVVLGKAIEDYVYLLIPALMRLLEFTEISLAVQLSVLDTIAQFTQQLCLTYYASRLLHPFSRTLVSSTSPELHIKTIECICLLIYQLRDEFLTFMPMISKSMKIGLSKLSPIGVSSVKPAGDQYDILVEHLLQKQTLPPPPSFLLSRRTPALQPLLSGSSSTNSLFGSYCSNAGGSTSTGTHEDFSGGKKLHVNQQNLRRAWEASQRLTREDWSEWMRRFSVELLRESPSPALRSCSALAQVYPPLARELFNAAFVSCWTELYDQYQDYLVRSLETAFQSDSIPPEILQALLNLAEFMEHDVEALPIDIRQLGELAEKCHAYAKALHYKELEFHTSPSTCIEALISINNQLGQPEAAAGILKYAQQHHADVIDVKESWFEKLQSWHEALRLYRKKELEDGGQSCSDVEKVQIQLGEMRCLEALCEWEELAKTSERAWRDISDRLVMIGSSKQTKKLKPSVSVSSGKKPMKNQTNSQVEPKLMQEGDHNDEGYVPSRGDEKIGQFSRRGSGKNLPTSHFSTSSLSSSPMTAATTSTWQSFKPQVAMLAARACWSLGKWKQMEEYVNATDPKETQATLYRAILCVHHNQFRSAQQFIDQTRKHLDTKLTALVGESYNRAYTTMVVVQQLAELEEIITYKKLRKDVSHTEEAARYRRHLMSMWKKRLHGCKRVVEVWQDLLAVRSLILSPQEDIDTYLKFASLCRQSGNLSLSLKVLTVAVGVHGVGVNGSLNLGKNLNFFSNPGFMLDMNSSTPVSLATSSSTYGFGEKEHHRVVFAYLKHLWAVGEREAALQQLGSLVQALSRGEENLKVKCHLKLGEWHLAVNEQEFSHVDVTHVLKSFKIATELDSKSYKAWHAWALMNFQVVEHSNLSSDRVVHQAEPHIAPAVHGFFRSIALGRSRWAANVQQDILRLLTLWFAHGHRQEVHSALASGFDSVSIETWLGVIPQLIARIHTPHPQIKHQLHQLLCAIGAEHPQALIYPLSVALKSPLQVRQLAAESIMATMRRHFVKLVDQALLVSRELIRVAILWHEMWHEGLEEASRLYFGEHDTEGMLSTLEPLHQMMEKGPETLREVSFQQAFGRDLQEAYEWIKKYRRGGAHAQESDLNHAWDLYYHVFRRINKQLPQLTTLELQYVSPALLEARNLELAVPGTYHTNSPVIRITSFMPTVHVITSKQRPRKITIHGNDGLEYTFLLKGHEDLRQDERVMQLFGLVNALLMNDRTTSKRDLKIQRYSVIPLSHNVGVVGWVPHSDTLHQLIRDYREARKILLNIEHRLMLQMAPDYDNLSLIQKIEVFEYALENTAGQDLYKVLWLKSPNSEVWLDRRTNYTRSLAVMSMVGYILGLGDRHPSNLMLDRFSGNIVHIDFGDCFEVAMHREKYPEKIPFRLTRMLTNAMEVSGIEGNFRYSCESVMHVLRENRDSLMAMLEAFVHDPLICWRLLVPKVASPPRDRSSSTDCTSSLRSQTYSDSSHPIGTSTSLTIPSISDSAGKMTATDASLTRRLSRSAEVENTESLGARKAFTPSEKNASDTKSDVSDPNSKVENKGSADVESISSSDPVSKTVKIKVEGEEIENSSESVSVEPKGSPPVTIANLSVSEAALSKSRNLHLEISSMAASLQLGDEKNAKNSRSITGDTNSSSSTSVAQSGVRANRSHRERELVHALGPEGAAAPREALNEKAVAVIRRVQAKLTGKDFDDNETLDVSAQVQRLVNQAASHENLCQCYIGWCPFW